MLCAPAVEATNVTTLSVNRRKTSFVLTAVVKHGQTSSPVDLSGSKELVPKRNEICPPQEFITLMLLDYVAF